MWIIYLFIVIGFLASGHGAVAGEGITLAQAVEIAFVENLALKSEESLLAQSKGEASQTGALFPSAARLEIGGETDALTSGEGGYAVDAALSQEFEIAGQHGLRKKIAALEVDKATQSLQWARSQLRQEVKYTFYQRVYLREKEQILSRLATSNRELAGQASVRAAEGVMTTFDRNLWAFESTRSESAVKQVQVEKVEAQRQWRDLLGSDEAARKPLIGTLPQDVKLPPQSELVALALSERADLKAMRLDALGKDHDYRLVKRSRVPNPELSVGYVRSFDKIGQEDFQGDPAVISGLSGIERSDHALRFGISLPLPMGRGQRGQLAKAKAAADGKGYQAAGLEAKIKQQVEALYERVVLGREGVRRYAAVVRSVDSDLAALHAAYQTGTVDGATFLNYRDRLVQAKLDALDATWMFVEDVLALELASGKSLEGNL